MHKQPKLHPSLHRSSFMLDKQSIEKFLSHCDRTTYSAKKNIFSPGDAADTIYYVVSGSLAIVSEETTKSSKRRNKALAKKRLNQEHPKKSNEDLSDESDMTSCDPSLDSEADGGDVDQQLVLGYINAGEFVGEVGLFIVTSTSRHVSFKTRAASEIASISYDKLLQLMNGGDLTAECPKILYTIGLHLAKRLFLVSRKASSLAFVDVTERILRSVFELAQHPEALTHPQGMQIKASRQELARLSGCSREMAGKALKQLEKENKLTAHGKTIVLFCER